MFLSSGGLFGSVIREFWNFWGSSIVAPKVFSVAAELVGKPEKTDTWQKKQEGEVKIINDEHFASLLSMQMPYAKGWKRLGM